MRREALGGEGKKKFPLFPDAGRLSRASPLRGGRGGKRQVSVYQEGAGGDLEKS